MRYEAFACLGSVELSNYVRTQTYVTNVGIPGLTIADDCNCPALTEGYGGEFTLPASDDAPWYDSSVAESEDFLGMVATDLRVLSAASRDINITAGYGGVVGRLGHGARTVQVRGIMVASTPLGMSYGEDWLREALAGCYQDGSCADDTLTLLPACPDDLEGDPAEPYFRYLHKVGVTDGPTFTQIQDLPECTLQNVAFQLSAGVPYLYQSPTTVASGDLTVSNTQECGLISTDSWPGNATATITLQGVNSFVENISISAYVTLDSSCPETTGMPYWSADIPLLQEDEILVIDGARREVVVWDPSSKRYQAGLALIETDEMWRFLDIAPCTEVCVCVSRTAIGAGTVQVTVEQVNRRL